ncbi:aspartyl-phosphate phosphatase Spo0E family protein [Ectobacillus sp. JY-23]|uniref:aspartyl-phosphate phosphatase Spo0E family protein n=1 Tax=Ectobacillus sp. JY-23 TaxID=2933872 RepID=UPI001FF2D0C9|nr:aspartyl-phosphate phosphatase Spo0E family protein [Ectobacillus sp. JY-23]UOY92643.1 aspartyl-phosphate phosphatase Spo0E family protein [Ectobacillus sp. JY-23]
MRNKVMFAARRKHKMDKLLLEIKVKQERMIQIGLSKGFNNPETIEASQSLDVLILQYQIHKEKLDKSWDIKESLLRIRDQFSKASIQSLLASLLR